VRDAAAATNHAGCRPIRFGGYSNYPVRGLAGKPQGCARLSPTLSSAVQGRARLAWGSVLGTEECGLRATGCADVQTRAIGDGAALAAARGTVV
jgi:hypothetical protein